VRSTSVASIYSYCCSPFIFFCTFSAHFFLQHVYPMPVPFNSNSACTTELYIVNCVHYTCVELQLLYAVVVFCNTFTERMHLQRNDAVL